VGSGAGSVEGEALAEIRSSPEESMEEAVVASAWSA
jgi:hypothetical protein